MEWSAVGEVIKPTTYILKPAAQFEIIAGFGCWFRETRCLFKCNRRECVYLFFCKQLEGIFINDRICKTTNILVMKLNKTVEHLLVWLALIVLRIIANIGQQSFLESLSVALLLYGIYALVFYTTSNAQKRYFENKKLMVLFANLLFVLFGGTFLIRVGFNVLEASTTFSLPIGVTEYGILRILFVILCAELYQVFRNKKKAEQRAKQIQLEKTEKELQFLKNQMNPHFFFNTLNNIYGLAYKQDKRTPEVILMLSESMRYIIYETQSDFVPLSKEISFIKNYVELEQLRLINNKNIKLNAEAGISPLKIAPLILLPFIENCFKHGNIDESEHAQIEINIWIENEILNFSSENTFVPQKKHLHGGVGIENVKKRLNIIYDKSYSLETNIEGDKYFVFLSVPLKKI